MDAPLGVTNYRIALKVLARQQAQIFYERKMKQEIDSDYNPAMLANNAFESIIDTIRTSNLNFQLQMSPFSAQISLKNSLVMERTGVFRLPPSTPSAVRIESDDPTFTRTNKELNTEFDKLKLEHSRAVDDRDKAYTRIKFLEAELERISIKHEKADDIIAETESLKVGNRKLSTEIQ